MASVIVTLDGMWTLWFNNNPPQIGDVRRFSQEESVLPGWAKCVEVIPRREPKRVYYETVWLGCIIALERTRVERSGDVEVEVEQQNYGIEERLLESCVRQTDMSGYV